MQIFATQNFTFDTFFSLKNIAFRLMLISISFATGNMSCLADNRAVRFDDFTISVPEQFTIQKRPPAALYLSHKNQQFPTFNIIKQAGSWPYEKLGKEEQKAKIEHEYRAIGLKSSEALSISDSSISGMPATLIELSYNSDKQSFRSRLWVLSLKDRHYLLTAVFSEPVSRQLSASIDDLVSSIRQQSGSQSESKTDLQQPASGKKYSFLVLAAIFAGYFYFRKSRRRSKD